MAKSEFVKFSEITTSDLVNYLRIAETTQSDLDLLSTILEAAKAYVLQFTGRDEETANNYPDFTIAVYVISAEMYDKRSYSVDSERANQIVESILGSRSINLL